MKTPVANWKNPLVMNNGSVVFEATRWVERRQEIAAILLSHQYGELPDVPGETEIRLLHSATANTYQSGAFNAAKIYSYRIDANRRPAFTLRLMTPAHDGPFPVVLNGDSCWNYANDVVVTALLSRGYAFAQFNRVEIMSDLATERSQQTLCAALQGFSGGAIAAWAWGFHRAIDALTGIKFIDKTRICVTGHSRGGKAALLAGALDERISLTSANNSGTAGAASTFFQGQGAETISELTTSFPHWLAGDIGKITGPGSASHFDQHFLRALVAPRALLTTEALDDHWANPTGSHLMQQAAQPVFDLLGAPNHNAIVFRQGGHAHTLDDWLCLLDFADRVCELRS